MKMNTYSKKLLLLLLINGLSVTLSAQHYCDVVLDDTQEEISDEVLYCYSNAISIEDGLIENFISSGINSLYNEAILVPDPRTDRSVEGLIYFEWAAIPEASAYQFSYLNMTTGASGMEWTNSTEYEFYPEENTAYVFLISTIISGPGDLLRKSADFIIIDEKPIIILDPQSFLCSCTRAASLRDNHVVSEALVVTDTAPLSEVKIYPNPSAGLSYLNYTLSTPQEVSIVLTDALGRVKQRVTTVARQSPGVYQIQIPLNRLPAGWYQCIIKTESGWERFPLLKYD